VALGYEVQVVTDAVSSRNVENKEIGLQNNSAVPPLISKGSLKNNFTF
jgi:hypothetical protein